MPNRPPVFRPAGTPTPRQRDRARGTAAEREYDHRWNEFSAKLKRLPEFRICCCGCGQLSEVIDHIVALDGPDDQRRFQLDQLQPMAAACHNRKSIKHDGAWGKPPDKSPEAQAELQAMLDAAKARAAVVEERMMGVIG